MISNIPTSKDPEWVRAMQELRRSSATTPVPSKKKYRRKKRTEGREENDTA